MSTLETVDAAELQSLVRAQGTTLLVDFFADWCGPCAALEPELEATKTTFGPALHIVRVDAEAHRDVATRFGVDGFPTLVLFKSGTVIARISGYRDSAQLDDELMAVLDVSVSARMADDAPPPLVDDLTIATPSPPEGGGLNAEHETGRPATRPVPSTALSIPVANGVRLLVKPPEGRAYALSESGDVEVPLGSSLTVSVEPDAAGSPIDLSLLSLFPPGMVESVEIDGPILDGALDPLTSLSGLRRLSIFSDDEMPAAALGCLNSLTRLTSLTLDVPTLDDEAIQCVGVLGALETLSIYRAEYLGDRGLTPLANLRALTSLSLCAHAASDAGVARLLHELPALASLELCVPRVDTLTYKATAGLPGLRKLDLDAPGLDTDGVRSLVSGTPNLSNLCLWGETIDNEMIREIAEASNLALLSLPDVAASAGLAVALLELRAALPDLEINGIWLARDAVEKMRGAPAP